MPRKEAAYIIIHATRPVFPSIGGVAFSMDGDPIDGTLYILVDPVTRGHGRKFTSGMCRGGGFPWMEARAYIER